MNSILLAFLPGSKLNFAIVTMFGLRVPTFSGFQTLIIHFEAESNLIQGASSLSTLNKELISLKIEMIS